MMEKLIVLLLIGIVILSGCISQSSKTKLSLNDGDICYVDSGKGDYKIIKILKIEKIDEQTIYHTRIYKNRFSEPPAKEQLVNLSIGTIHEEEVGIGHTPLSEKTLFGWNPVCIKNENVTEEELEGYYMWKESFEKGEAGFY